MFYSRHGDVMDNLQPFPAQVIWIVYCKSQTWQTQPSFLFIYRTRLHRSLQSSIQSFPVLLVKSPFNFVDLFATLHGKSSNLFRDVHFGTRPRMAPIRFRNHQTVQPMVAAVKLIPVELVAKTPPRLKMIKVDFKWCHVYSVSPSLISQCLVVNNSQYICRYIYIYSYICIHIQIISDTMIWYALIIWYI